MMKVAVSSYSFSQKLNAGELTQFDCIAKAREMGFDAIEFVGIQPHDGSTAEEYAKKLGEECRRLQMPVSNYTVGAEFMKEDGAKLDEEVERLKKEVDIAVLLGAVSMRHDATYGYPEGTRGYRGFDDCLPVIAEGCRRVTEYAQTKGVRTMVENHGTFCQDSDRVEKLVNRVAHPNFGLLNDMGNFLCADEDPAKAIGRVAPYAFYVHAKDFHVKTPMEPNPGQGFFRSRSGCYLRGAIIGHGDVPVKHCLMALKRAGYDGYVAIEFEGMEDAYKGLAIGLENLRRYISEIEE